VFGTISLVCCFLTSIILCDLGEDPFAYAALASALVAVVAGFLAGRDTKGHIAGGWGFGAGLGVMVVFGTMMAFSALGGGGARKSALRSICMSNLRSLGNAVMMYENNNHGEPAPDLPALVAAQYTSSALFVCPQANSGRPCDYFYFPPPAGVQDGRLMMCDLAGNHGPDGRSVLTAGVSCKWVTEADFQALLARPENAEFAAALKAAEPANKK
jgi:hypothetical protein